MPANFPTAEQKRYYSRFVEGLTPEQLGGYFHLTDTDRHLVYSRTKEHTRLGLAVQLGTVRFLGLFLTDSQWLNVPHNVVQYVAAQLSLPPALWQAYSDIVFGFFRLLGYRFSPRLADLGDARFWRMNRKTNYGVLDGLARHKTNNSLIADNWDDMLRAAGSLLMSTVKASELIKSLHRAGRTSTLGRAIAELGRIEKSLFLLSWIDDITYRRRVSTQLTRIEGRHRLAGALRFGRKGKLYEQYREGQEDELNTLGLVLNMVVLWTTRYMDAALNYLRDMGFDVRDEDVERLSPLVSEHINFVGKYHFSLPEEVQRGELRPFHNPDDPANII